MRTIIIPDIHNRVEWIEPTLSKLEYDKVIILGDIFDDFYDTSRDTERTAEWLKQSVQKPHRIHLLGTHDVWYNFPWNPYLMASGNSPEKALIINSIMDRKDWNHFGFVYPEQGFLLSHAGVHQMLIDEYVHRHDIVVNNLIDDVIIPATNEAAEYAEDGDEHPWLAAGFSRGGSQRVGGIIWLNWTDEFNPIDGLNQIVGHTQIQVPDVKMSDFSINYNLDTYSRYIGILENGKLSFRGVKFK